MDRDKILARPEMVQSLTMSQARDIIRSGLELFKGRKGPALVRLEGKGNIYFVGDIHGDFYVMRAVVKKYLESPDSTIVFLGDIIDRAPPDCPFGGINSMLLAVVLKLSYPDNVLILRGNHEGHFVRTYDPYELDREVVSRFGDPRLHEDFTELFKLLPLMAQTESGIFCSHGGIPKLKDWRSRGKDDVELSLFTTWGDHLESRTPRGLAKGFGFSRDEMCRFLASIGARAFIRGHDPGASGFFIYDSRCLTLHTSRRYEKSGNGGILIARAGAGKRVMSIKDIAVERLEKGEWRRYKVREMD